MRIYFILILLITLASISPVFAEETEPISFFTASPVSGQNPLTVQFTDQSQGEPTSWSWSFGDGSTSTLQNPKHTYNYEGIFDVSLTTSNAYGQTTGTKIQYIRVGIESTASFVANPVLGTPPLNVTFTDCSSESPTSWEWKFGDGSGSTIQNPFHEYTNPGTYDVSLAVKSPVGTFFRIRENYINVGFPPEAQIESSAVSGSAPLKVFFTDLSLNNPDTWFWSFGDGQNSTVQNPEHIFTEAGEYEVTLIAENAFGKDIEVLSTQIIVAHSYNPPSPYPDSNLVIPPIANFSATPLKGDAPLQVRFTDTSQGGVTEWRWNFGDGKLSSEKGPTHTYLYPGLYDVTLIIKNSYSANSTLKTGYINVTGSVPSINPYPTQTTTPSPYEPKGTYTPGNSNQQYINNSGEFTGEEINSSSLKNTEASKSVWLWVSVYALLFIILIVVLLYLWTRMSGGGGRDSL